MSWMNRQVPAALVIPISSVAANAGTEKVLFELRNSIEIVGARFVGDREIKTDNDSGFTLAILNEGTSGTLGRTVASRVANTVAATFAATQSIELTPSDATWTDSQTATRRATEVDAGEVLSWKESTIGTGTARSNGQLIIEYVII